MATLINSLSPSSVAAGDPDFTLTINGSGLVNTAVAFWNGTPLATTFLSASQVTAQVPTALIAKSGVGMVTLQQSGTSSNALTVAITNAIDLVTLADVKDFLEIRSTQQGIPITADDAFLQSRITAISQYWLTRTCRPSLNSIQTISERYDGNGRDTLLLRQWPIHGVSSLTVDGMPVPASPDYIQPGWVLNERKTGLVIIGAGCYGNGFYAVSFAPGRMNVAVTYTAGYDGTPGDIYDAVVQHVAYTFKRRSTIDRESTSLPSTGGTTKYLTKSMPPICEEVLQNYRRLWP